MIEDELDDFLKRLPPGTAILSHLRCSDPVVVMNPLVELPRVFDDELEKYMGEYWRAYSFPAKEEQQETTNVGISEEQKRFLMEVVNHPYECSTAYYKTLSLSASTGNRVKKQLESMQLIRLHQIQLNRRGGIPEAIEILSAGYERLAFAPQKLPGKGGFVHAWWIGRIARKIADKKPVVEKVLNGKAVDLGIETVVGWLGYEVQLDSKESLLKDLIAKDLVGFQHVTICVPTTEDSERVKAVVLEMKAENKVESRLLAEFY